MTDQIPAPLVPAEVDLRGLEYMPYYGDRLRESGLNARATDAEYRAAHNLWWSAWKQTPAASLPNDDIDLCRLADLGRDMRSWEKIRERSLHGFVVCSDGRLYHPVLAAIALEVWEGRKTASVKGKLGASKRWEKHRQLKEMAQASGKNGPGNGTTKKKDGREVKRSEGKKDLDLLDLNHPTRSPTGQDHLKNSQVDQRQGTDANERHRRIGQAMAAGDGDLAKRIREGTA